MDRSDTKRTQVVRRGHWEDMLVELFKRIENFFRLFELHTHFESVMTEPMKDVIAKIMVEVLGIFGTAMNIMKRLGRSESTLDARWTIADTGSALFSPIGMEDIEDALHRLDILMRREWMAAQVLQVTRHG